MTPARKVPGDERGWRATDGHVAGPGCWGAVAVRTAVRRQHRAGRGAGPLVALKDTARVKFAWRCMGDAERKYLLHNYTGEGGADLEAERRSLAGRQLLGKLHSC